jgi:hypothetical protein
VVDVNVDVCNRDSHGNDRDWSSNDSHVCIVSRVDVGKVVTARNAEPPLASKKYQEEKVENVDMRS